MKRYIILPFIAIPFFLFSQNRENFGYEDFKRLFIKYDSVSSYSSVIPRNDFTDFLFDTQINQTYYAVEMISINSDIDFFVLNQNIIFDDEDDNVNCRIYLIFKGKQLVREYDFDNFFRLLELHVVSDGGTIDQSCKIQENKSISIEYYHLDCCSSTGFDIPIETKTNIIFYVSDQGELLVKDVLKWEISSPFFNSNFQDSIAKNQNFLYPSVDNSYNITIDNNNVYIPITDNDDQIFFFFNCKANKRIPVLVSKNKEGEMQDLLVIEKDMKETDRSKINELKGCKNFYSHPLMIMVDDKLVKLSIDNNGHFIVEFN